MKGTALAAVRQRLDGWRRKHGGRGKRIPEALWTEAARVARAEGLSTTARTLGLRVEGLKRRVGGSRRPVVDGGRVPAFVELTGMGSLGGSRAVVELVNAGGEQMRVHLMGASTGELVSLAEALWSRRS
jgi:hypothetical protein